MPMSVCPNKGEDDQLPYRGNLDNLDNLENLDALNLREDYQDDQGYQLSHSRRLDHLDQIRPERRIVIKRHIKFENRALQGGLPEE